MRRLPERIPAARRLDESASGWARDRHAAAAGRGSRWERGRELDDGNVEVIARVMMAVGRSGTAALRDTDAADGFVVGASGVESVPKNSCA